MKDNQSAITDIMSRKQAEETLQESEARFRDLYDNAPMAYFSISIPDGSILQCNNAALRLLGYSKNAMLRMTVFDLYAKTPDGLTKARQVFKKVKAGISARDVELQMAHKKGHLVWISLSAEPVMNLDRKTIKTRSVAVDISSRKQAEEALKKAHDELEQRVKEGTAALETAIEELHRKVGECELAEAALRESEQKYSTLVEDAMIGVILVQNGKIEFANDKLAEIYGCSRNELIGVDSLVLVHPDDRELS
jgi:PAS domain S-box-containing protein